MDKAATMGPPEHEDEDKVEDGDTPGVQDQLLGML